MGGLPANASILCVAKAETHARIDAKVLRGLGLPQPRWLASGLEAARHLAEHGADLVLVDEDCREMSGVEFVRLIRLHPRLATTPVVALATNSRSSTVLQAMAAGCSGFCLRPYSPEALLRESLRAVQRAPVLAQEILDSLNGQACSEGAFAGKLAALESIQVEIERTFTPPPPPPAATQCPAAQHRQLAREWKEQGRPDKVRHHLQEGAKALARAGKSYDAWAMLDPLRQANPQVEPACAVAEACVRDGELTVAAGLMGQTLRRTKRPAMVYDAARRACCFTPHPHDTARQLADALVREGVGATSMDVFLDIMHDAEPAPQRLPERRSLLAAMPSLHDVVMVARHTFATYRKVNRGEALPMSQHRLEELQELEGLG
ncbi:putative response regulator receiver [Megalodesulfovibrio gigas DSM 1382 = ATCC 19364]|uniref:Putative response regulator receiver n=2 Tax=Megalodesulfovibrio gigas TaxID=879 RepID=T2GB02_MEGG1|nr:putative response regulator receiver [Megalodesulfovibrio gigas DSM 1382 = ATCC 19364]